MRSALPLAALLVLAGCSTLRAPEVPETPEGVNAYVASVVGEGAGRFNLSTGRLQDIKEAQRPRTLYPTQDALQRSFATLERFDGYLTADSTGEAAVFTYRTPEDASRAVNVLRRATHYFALSPGPLYVVDAQGAYFRSGRTVVRVLSWRPGLVDEVGRGLGIPTLANLAYVGAGFRPYGERSSDVLAGSPGLRDELVRREASNAQAKESQDGLSREARTRGGN